jgi:hypothetical protein
MILILALSLLGLSNPLVTPAGEQSKPMTREVAQARIVDVLKDEINLEVEVQIETLNEVIERCDDQDIRANAFFNLGVILLKQINEEPALFEEAVQSLRNSDVVAANSKLRIDARYAIGHAYYALANRSGDDTKIDEPTDLQSVIDSMQEKISLLEESAGAFRSILEIDSKYQDAARNVEIIRLQIQELRELIEAAEELLRQQEQQEQERQQQNQQQQQDAADKLNELAQEQQNQADKSEESPPENQQQQREQRDDQRELSDKTEAAREEIAEQDSENKENLEQIEEKIQEAQEAQNAAQRAMEEGDQELAAREQEKAADALQEAAESMQELADESAQKGESEGEGNEGDGENEGDEGEAPGQASENSKEDKGDEISEVAKQLLDKERREREQRQAYKATGKPTRVEKDW